MRLIQTQSLGTKKKHVVNGIVTVLRLGALSPWEPGALYFGALWEAAPVPVIKMEHPSPSDCLQDRRLVVRRTYEVTWKVAWWYLREELGAAVGSMQQSVRSLKDFVLHLLVVVGCYGHRHSHLLL